MNKWVKYLIIFFSIILLLILIAVLYFNTIFILVYKKNTFSNWLVKEYFPKNLEEKARFSDKYLVKKYIRENFPELKTAKTLFNTKNPNDLLNFDFPEKSVIKANHGAGMNIILKNKPTHLKNIIKKCKGFLNTTYGIKKNLFTNEEPHYAKMEPVIFVEEFLDDNGNEPIDYKFHVFSGEIMFIQVDLNRFGNNHSREILNSSWQRLNVKKGAFKYPKELTNKPKNLDKMIGVCKKFYSLNPNIEYVRVDFYELGTDMYFGEFTFSPSAGRTKFNPETFDNYLYDKFILKNTKIWKDYIT